MTLPYLYTPAESIGKIVIGKKGKTSSLPGSTRSQLSLRNTFWLRSEKGTDKTPWSGSQGREGAAPCDCQRKPDQDSLLVYLLPTISATTKVGTFEPTNLTFTALYLTEVFNDNKKGPFSKSCNLLIGLHRECLALENAE